MSTSCSAAHTNAQVQRAAEAHVPFTSRSDSFDYHERSANWSWPYMRVYDRVAPRQLRWRAAWVLPCI